MKKIILLIQVIFLFLTLTNAYSQSGWFIQNSGTTYDLKGVSFTDANNGTAVGDLGTIIRTTTGGVTFVNQISSEFSLYQNYPNPFNPTTNIKFDIQKTTVTKMIIYDELGREIATLVNEKLNTGSYEVDWDANRFASGVYFYRIEAGEFNQVKKMVLIK